MSLPGRLFPRNVDVPLTGGRCGSPHLHVSPAVLPPFCGQVYCSLPLLPSPITSSTTSSTIPELRADGVLIKSSRNRTVSKQCSTCQLSNCWALLQPLCLAREWGKRVRNNKKKKKMERRYGGHKVRRQMRSEEIRKPRKSRKGSWRGWAKESCIHLAAGARKAQLVEVQGGYREVGAVQSWDGLVCAVLGWSRPVGAAHGLQPPGYGIQAQFPSPTHCSVVSTVDTWPMQFTIKLWVSGPAHFAKGELTQTPWFHASAKTQLTL